jgi:hypothetical protein
MRPPSFFDKNGETKYSRRDQARPEIHSPVVAITTPADFSSRKLDELELRALGFIEEEHGVASDHLGGHRYRCQRCGFWIPRTVRCCGVTLCVDCVAMILND